MARVLHFLDAPLWSTVRLMYLQDKVVEAFEEAEELGGQDSNDLFAEAEVRKQGVRRALRPWLNIEAIEAEVGHGLPERDEQIALACEEVATRFQWNHAEPTLISFLPSGAEAAWMPGRWGYFVQKSPYGKICLPNHLAFQPEELLATVRHEFMHQVSASLSHEHLSRWLSEGLSTLVEGRFDPGLVPNFRSGHAAWQNPGELNQMVSTDNRKAELHRKILFAYGQSQIIVRHLVRKKGESSLSALLREIGDESVLHNLEAQILSRSRTDSAIRRVYGLSEAELFKEARP